MESQRLPGVQTVAPKAKFWSEATVPNLFRCLMLTLMLVFAQAVFAQASQAELDELEAKEAKLAEAFQSGMEEIVEDLNKGSFKKLAWAIDKNDMLDRIFGLRLIDQRMKRDFREDMKDGRRFNSYIESYYADEAKDGIKAKLLLVESRGDSGRAVVRFDMSHFQVNYIEYDLQLVNWDRIQIIDWTDYLWGHQYSDRMGLMMVQSQPNKNAARKLVDFPSVREQEVFQIMEILKATRDRNFDRYFDIMDSLSGRLKRQRVLLKVGLDATRQARRRRSQRKILEAVDEHYPEDALFALALLDLYFPDKQYEKAHAALLRVRDRLRVEDAVMKSRLSAATLVLDRIEDARDYATQSVEMEPDLELGWWALLRAQVAAEQHADAIAAMEKLKSEFGHDLDPESLGKDPSFARLVRSPEYKDWLEASD